MVKREERRGNRGDGKELRLAFRGRMGEFNNWTITLLGSPGVIEGSKPMKKWMCAAGGRKEANLGHATSKMGISKNML